MYEPSNKELREIIQDEGSFSITEMQANNPFVGLDSALMVPSRFASVTRAIFEPIIVLHFGEVMDEFVRTLERRWSVEGMMQCKTTLPEAHDRGWPYPSRGHDQVTGVSHC